MKDKRIVEILRGKLVNSFVSGEAKSVDLICEAEAAYLDDISDKVVLEGKIAVNVFCEEISQKNNLNGHYPIIAELYKVFNSDYKVSNFVSNILKD